MNNPKKFNEIALVLVAASSTIALTSNLLLINDIKKLETTKADIEVLTDELIRQNTLINELNTKSREQENSTNTQVVTDDAEITSHTNEMFVVNKNVNLRQSSGLNGVVVNVVPEGETVIAISEEPINTDGHTWVQIESSVGNGWVSQKFLEKSGE